jgi:hypothetical protein
MGVISTGSFNGLPFIFNPIPLHGSGNQCGDLYLRWTSIDYLLYIIAYWRTTTMYAAPEITDDSS